MKSHRFLLAAPFALLVLAGCGKSGDSLSPTSSSGSADQLEITQEITNNAALVEDGGLSAVADQTGLDEGDPSSPLPPGMQDAIAPRFFWRTIRSVQRRHEFQFADYDTAGRPWTAIVTVHKRLLGGFHILTVDSIGPGDVVRSTIDKPLEDHWVRRVLLKRVRTANSDRAVWRIAGTTAVRVTAKDARTQIQSLRVQGGGLDTTITNPLEFFRLRQVLRVDPDAEVRLTVTTLQPDDVVLLYSGHRRFRFRNNGDGTYSGAWKSPALLGVRHVGVNALSHGTLFDDTAPYDSQAWILPYLVRPEQLDDPA
jgi:hypothetical protein